MTPFFFPVWITVGGPGSFLPRAGGQWPPLRKKPMYDGPYMSLVFQGGPAGNPACWRTASAALPRYYSLKSNMTLCGYYITAGAPVKYFRKYFFRIAKGRALRYNRKNNAAMQGFCPETRAMRLWR